jgi:hypothetical protein
MSGKGCLALGGLVLLAAGALLGLAAAGEAAGLLRSDPAGLGLVAAAVGLLGLALFVAATAARRR